MSLDSFQISLLEQAAEYNAANPDPVFSSSDTWVRDALERAGRQRSVAPATPFADTHNVPLRDRKPSSGASNYAAQGGSTPKQEAFIRSLAAERGVDADALLATIRSSRDASKAIDRLKATPRQAAVRPATERQVEFLQDLLATRVHDYTDEAANGVSFADASSMIEVLLGSPKAKTGAHGIRHGRYAFQPADGPAQFYRVAQGGRIYVQAGPAEHPYNGKLNVALEAIKADPQAHAALYGQLIGRCGRCGLELTDETSRAQGLGPVCVEKSDW